MPTERGRIDAETPDFPGLVPRPSQLSIAKTMAIRTDAVVFLDQS
jgi:hypothetical protein